MLNLPYPINFSSLKSVMLSPFLVGSVVVVDTVSLKSFRLISSQSCLHFYDF